MSHGGDGGFMKIEFEDDDILVVYKEAGLPVQAGRTSRTDLVSMLKNYLHGKAPLEAEPYLGIIHRLDQPVEGLLLFAKNRKAAAQLSRQVSAKSDMQKVYQAIVMLPDAAALAKAKNAQHRVVTLSDDLLRDYQTNMSSVVQPGTQDSKTAELTYRTLRIAQDGRTALMEIHLHTGRHHQIRVQMAHAGMPLMGDRKYGPADPEYKGGLCLCAASVRFRHPSTGQKMQYSIVPSFI
jgi:23S rRNA pseudouridine1911/1915/1917 synthase